MIEPTSRTDDARRSRPTRRALMLGHSYVVGLNRRLPNEVARSGSRWQVTVVAPDRFPGEHGLLRTRPGPDESAELVTVPVTFGRSPHLFVYGTGLREVLRRPWDVIHVWEEPYVLAGWQAAYWARPETPIMFWTGQSTAKAYPAPFSWIEQYCLTRCTAWASRGESGYRHLLARGYATKPGFVVPLGVDTTVFRPDRAAGAAVRRELGWTDSAPPVVGYLGRFVEEKGIRLLTDALARLGDGWRALFVGAGPLDSFIRQWAQKYAGRVKVVGGVRHDQVPGYLNAMDVLCAPSQTAPHWREVFGRMLTEAAACGVPVIGSDSGEIPNVIQAYGLVIGERDRIGWTAAIDRVLRQPDLRAELRERGLQTVRSVYGWATVAQKHIEVFERLAGDEFRTRS